MGTELLPPYGIGHAINGATTLSCKFAIDSMCRPISVVTSSFVERMGYIPRPQRVLTSLAHPSAPPIESTNLITCELVVHWNGKRRTFFIEAMVWDSLPDDQDLIVSMPDALDTGLIAFALPHQWRRSWLGTAAFNGNLPLALRQDQSLVAALHNDLVMDQKDEDLIDITQRLNLSKAHIVTDIMSLTAAQRYWLEQFPTLNETIPEDAHPKLPKFDPPFNEKQMQQYQDRPPTKLPRCSPKLQDKINDTFAKMSDAKLINLHANPVGVASYVVLIPKPDGTYRICINFSKVNKLLLRHHYPLPPCADLISRIARHKYYAKLDLYNGFYNFDVAQSAQWLTSTVAPGHALTWRKIPQGLAPVPSWFQWAMETVLLDYVGTICLLYIDDLIILADSPEELNENIRKILARLAQFNFRISIKKCDFEPTQEITFLGHRISHGKIQPLQNSAEILKDIVNPNAEKEDKDKISKLSTFLGLVNWFAKYIPDCSRQLLPLLNLKTEGWKWTQTEEDCFQKFKNILCDLKPLHLPSGSNNRLEIHTDASKDGWFAVLFEDTGGPGPPQDRLRVIAYAGGVFRKNQLSWSVLQKEMFAVYQAHLKFDPLIRLHEFRLVMDNKTMTFCETSSDPMVQRWYLRIQHYMSEIIHLPGVLNIIPDAGSRLLHLNHPNVTQGQFQALSAAFCSMLSQGPPKTITYAPATPVLLTSRTLSTVLGITNNDIPDADDAVDDMTIRNLQTRYASLRGCVGEVVSSCTHHSDPSSAASDILEPSHRPRAASTVARDSLQHTDLHDWLHGNFSDINDGPGAVTNAVSISSSACARLAAEPSTARRALPILPEHVHLIRTCHGGMAGHHGRDETIRKLQHAGHHWPTRYIDVARYVASCPICQRFRLKRKQPYAMYKTILTDSPMFGRWHCDYLTIRVPCSFTAATKIFVMEEERCKYVMLHAVKDETAVETVLAFLHTFSIFGIPELVYSDNAPNLIQASVREFIRITGIQHDFSVPHQAHTNGMVERTCGDTSRLLRMLCADLHAYGKWSLLLPLVQRMLNSMTRSTLGTSANQLVFGNRVNLDRFIIPTAPQPHDDAVREAVAASDTVQHLMDTLLVAQQDLLHKADQIRIRTLNDLTRSRPLKPEEQLSVGQLVLVPWNDTHQKPSRFAGNFMGPYVIVRSDPGKGTVALAHSISPTPADEPAHYVSAITEVRLYDDSLALAEYDIPEDRFRQLAYVNRNARPIQCIVRHQLAPFRNASPPNHVENFEYLVRFEDSTSLRDTSWLPYSAISHTFAFQAFYRCARLELTGHQCIAIPASVRETHQRRASTAHQSRRNALRHSQAASTYDVRSLQS